MSNLPKQSPSENKGQIVLIVLLISAVVLTISLSIVSQSVVDIEVSQQSEDSARAFSAAEAGIEKVLQSPIFLAANSDTFTTGAGYQYRSTKLGEVTDFAFPGEYQNNEVLTLWLATYDSETEVYTASYNQNPLRVVWGKTTSVNNPALEVSVYYKEGVNYKVGRFLLDPDDTRSQSSNNKFCYPGAPASQCTGISNFTVIGESLGGKTFQNGATLDLTFGGSRTLLYARIRAIYSTESQIFGAQGAGSSLPEQGIMVESVGQSGSSTRKIEVSRLKPAPSSFLDYVLYSGGDLVKP